MRGYTFVVSNVNCLLSILRIYMPSLQTRCSAFFRSIRYMPNFCDSTLGTHFVMTTGHDPANHFLNTVSTEILLMSLPWAGLYHIFRGRFSTLTIVRKPSPDTTQRQNPRHTPSPNSTSTTQPFLQLHASFDDPCIHSTIPIPSIQQESTQYSS